MSENIVIECPTTPDRIDQCPATPDRILSVKSPNSSGSSDAECTIRSRRVNRSPPPNCAICLGRFRNKCFTDSCLHEFCFKCLLEWSKVKAECPLCKQQFKSIIHNVKSIDQFEEYLVDQPQNNVAVQHIPPAPFSISGHLPQIRLRQLDDSLFPHSFNVLFNQLPAFSATVQVQPSTNNIQQQQLYLTRSSFNERLQHHPAGDVIFQDDSGQLWRQYIYDKKLYALPVVDVSGRYRECCARFYREYPAQLHRLLPFMHRDIVCMLRNTDYNVTHVLELITRLISIFDIISVNFRRRCRMYFNDKTTHFIHELVNFARSPYDVFGYDREVRYAPLNEEVVISSSPNSITSSDNEDVAEIIEQNVEINVQSSPPQNAASSSQNDIISAQLSTNNYNIPTVPFETMENGQQVIESITGAEFNRHITLTSSSSDDCEFVMEKKAPHLRTPELVSLNSDTDTDVVFVSESRTKTTTRAPTPCRSITTNKRKLQRYATVPPSSSDSDDNLVDEKLPLTNVQKALILLKHGKTENIKSEYNNGASTSAIHNDNRNTQINKELLPPTKKFYARPVRRLSDRKRKMPTKSVHEDSSDDEYSNSDTNTSSDTSWSARKQNLRKKPRKKSAKKRGVEEKLRKGKLKKSRKSETKKRKSRIVKQNRSRNRKRPSRKMSNTTSSSSDTSTTSPSSGSSSVSQSYSSSKTRISSSSDTD